MRYVFIVFAVVFALAGCVGTSPYDYKVSTKPYTVNGITYYPKATADDFSETGVASWYGSGFHGKKTASGETYNKHAYTAAHKTLPFGTLVKVTNLANGKTINVVINDRGPFKSGRIIDLSYVAAKKLDVINTGTANVRINVID